VSRIEVQPYSHSLKVALAVTVDAAINSGNSGGPVMNQKGELIGIAFQALEGAEAIGHIVPPAVIKHFLHGIKTFGPEYRFDPQIPEYADSLFPGGRAILTLASSPSHWKIRRFVNIWE
jgi:hypothetical protein